VSKKSFDGLAHALCDTAMGVRLGQSDFDVLASMPDGTIRVDALSAHCSHSRTGPIFLGLGAQLRSWFEAQFKPRHIDPRRVTGAEVEITYDTGSVETDRRYLVLFVLKCCGQVQVGDKSYTREVAEKRVWHRRDGA
jgi:hypothetical protein